ncbi:MarR family winged helix-turn-helix transcriptional regulator [Maledivibacter halophilus]|uniref:DNA-binding transcriptional regulator, MarR family n=1 Tax=Maledivibacter halophilus TaxID=36842 RepID=A0A1T5LY95_9FIRM|nr:MarR family transcriptional regulator [Maledivibacter halophilus]SKC80951.1 DNA-binding transcriptional regulator, MarR family [Maledivibacter halophilus]
MKDIINMDEIKAIDEIYHEIVFASQRGDIGIFTDKLKGVTTIEISILEIIHKNPDIILREIVNILGIPNSTLTNAINRLEKRNLVNRTISKRDKRSFGLELTQEGKLAQKEHKNGEKLLWQKLLNPLEKEERTVFLRCLRKIANNLKETNPKASY